MRTDPAGADRIIGRIGGKPVYAQEIFIKVGDVRLSRLGADHDEAGFRTVAAPLLLPELRAYLIHALIHREAERVYGAQQTLVAQDASVYDQRTALIEKYLHEKIWPHVSVSAAEIDAYEGELTDPEKIEHALRLKQFNRILSNHVSELLIRGEYTPIDEMNAALLDAAVARYAPRPFLAPADSATRR